MDNKWMTVSQGGDHERTRLQGLLCHPVEALHRRYEALRSVFVEEQPMKEVAQRFEVSYGTIRNWVSEFCRGQDAGQSAPFLPRHRVDGPWPTNSLCLGSQ